MNKIKDAKTEYENYLECVNDLAPESVIKDYRAIGTALDDYISELSFHGSADSTTRFV